MKNLLILGYYFQNNWGDSMFLDVFSNRLSQYNLTFKKLENFNSIIKIPFNYDAIIIGAGDIINDYYLSDELYNKIKTYIPDIPIIFVGIGLSYENLINKLDIGDYFFIRNKSDYALIKERFTHYYTHYTPDIVFDIYNNNINKISNKVNNITLSLPYPYIHNNNYTTDFLDTLDKCVSVIKDKNITFVPFDTSDNKSNSDYLIYSLIKERYPSINILNYNSNQELYEHFQTTDLVIGGRFHSIILSIITNTPFIALNGSVKMNKLKQDMELENFVDISRRGNNLYRIDYNQFEHIYNNIISNYTNIVDYLKIKCNNYKKALDITWNNIYDIIDNPRLRQSPPQYIGLQEKDQILQTTISNILHKFNNKISLNDITKLMKGGNLRTILPRQRDDSSIRKIITEEILWTLTGDPFSNYYYGLYENIFSYKFIDQLRWIIDDYYSKYYLREMYDRDNLRIINKNFQELHRSGWQYIVDEIVMDINTNTTINKKLILDTYVDKTFHWNKQFYLDKKIVPYTSDWIGFIHHTFSNYNNEYNCGQLLKDKHFIQSLEYCKGLIVMTKYLKFQLDIEFERLGIKTNVFVIYHPTEIPNDKFSWENFENNTDKKLIQIGNWMRDMFAIHRLELPKNSIINSKAVLKNRNSDNYFLPETFFPKLIENIKNAEINTNVYDICKISLSNMHLKGMYDNIVIMENSVNILQHLSNTEYDMLLTNNIVFLYLIDASAVNTLIECIVRNTPVIVNRIPPTIELLGEDYPLFYDNYYEASKILENTELIKSGYYYLLEKDISNFKIKTFIKNLKSILEQFLI